MTVSVSVTPRPCSKNGPQTGCQLRFATAGQSRKPPTEPSNKSSQYQDIMTLGRPCRPRKWCQKRDRDVSPKRYITMLYCDFSNFDTVENTVLALALVLNEDSNRCGRSISDQSATPKFILRPADNFLPENGEKPNQAAPNEAAMAGAISAASCCTTAPLPTNRSTLAIRRRSSPSIMP